MAEYAAPKVITNGRVVGALQQEVQRARDIYQERDRVMHEIRRMRLLRHRVFTPKSFANLVGGKRAVKLPIMYRLVQTAVASVMKKPPVVYDEPFNAADNRAAEDMARKDSLLLQTVENRAHPSFLYSGAFTLMGDGMVVIKTMPGPWSGFPVQATDEEPRDYNARVAEFLAAHPLPFYSRVVDPLTCYPPQGEYGEGVFIESAWRSTRDVMTALNLRRSADGRDLAVADPSQIPVGRPAPDMELPIGMAAMTRVDEIWTKDQCVVIIGGSNKVLAFDNLLGELPYEWGYADPTGIEDPVNVGMSVCFPLYTLTPWIDTLVGITSAWSLFAPPTIVTTQDPVPGQRNTTETRIDNIELGKMIHLPPGKKMSVLTPPNVGQSLLSFLGFLIDASDRGGLPAIVSGAGVGTRMPALTFQSVLESATERLRPAKESYERTLAGTIMKWHRIIGRYDSAVRVNGWEYDSSGDPRTRRWAAIYPDEARKGRRVQVTLPMDSTQDMIAKGTHASFMISAGIWDLERGMRFSGVDNPQETMDKIAADTARRAALGPLAQALLQSDPDIQQAMLTAAQQELGGEGGGGGTVELPPTAGAPPGPGRNRAGVSSNRGGGRRGGPTQRPRGNRGGPAGQTFGRT